MTVTIHKPKQHEFNMLADLSCELVKFNRLHDPKDHDFEIVLEARRNRAISYCEEGDDRRFIRLALVDKEPAGFICAHLSKTELAMDEIEPSKGSIDEVYVRDKYRSLGIGKKLINEALEWMKQRDIHFATLEVYAWNHNAFSFYEKAGFQLFDVTYGKKI